MPRRRLAPPKYAPLVVWLAALPADHADTTLTLAEIEALIGDQLPASAWTQGFWSSSDVARHNWGRAGFRGRLNRPNKSVRFTRVQQ
jgi:hypothetical protein